MLVRARRRRRRWCRALLLELLTTTRTGLRRGVCTEPSVLRCGVVAAAAPCKLHAASFSVTLGCTRFCVLGCSGARLGAGGGAGGVGCEGRACSFHGAVLAVQGVIGARIGEWERIGVPTRRRAAMGECDEGLNSEPTPGLRVATLRFTACAVPVVAVAVFVARAGGCGSGLAQGSIKAGETQLRLEGCGRVCRCCCCFCCGGGGTPMPAASNRYSPATSHANLHSGDDTAVPYTMSHQAQ